MEPYKSPLTVAEVEFTEKKSRFISRVAPVRSEGEALLFLDSVREQHRTATHNVYAYRTKNGNICRYSDAGEPSGTAGMPLLDVFVRQEVFDFCCVATRYFGGVMLGAGGLVRAYSRCGVIALEASGVGVLHEMAQCSASLPYPLYEIVRRQLAAYGADVTSEDFGESIVLGFRLPVDDLPKLSCAILEASSGLVRIVEEGRSVGVGNCPNFH